MIECLVIVGAAWAVALMIFVPLIGFSIWSMSEDGEYLRRK